jgi:hypothetical protein
LTLLLSIFSSLLIGLGLALAPWTPLWETNVLLHWNPFVRDFLLNTHVRGAVTGVGLVNVILAIEEIARFRRHVHGGRAVS